MNRLLPLATPKLSRSGNRLQPIDVEFIDGSHRLRSTVGLWFELLPLPPHSHPDSVTAEEQKASCSCRPDKVNTEWMLYMRYECFNSVHLIDSVAVLVEGDFKYI